MIKQEEIKLTTKRKGTIVKYFTTWSGQTSDNGGVSYLMCNPDNSPIKIVESFLDTQIQRNNKNNFIPSNILIIHTGTTITQNSELLTQEIRDKIFNKYKDSINKNLISLSGSSMETSYVQFEDIDFDDMHINVMLNRTTDVLDTLNIYNLAINELPNQESDTGVLFGKLEAIQNVSDENGNKIRIPLKNTPVILFNPTDEFPSLSSLDDNGNRISLNLKENINLGSYFNQQSIDTDYKYLSDTSSIKNIPEKYKYSSTTNENGEFILFNVPKGSQTLMYEVDLLKQGLTHDEVALNFFAYPTEDNPNIDNIPHFFFRQIPVNIVPSWGDFQTGYTQINISVQLNLRKWCTYYLSPIAYKTKSIEDMFLTEGVSNKLTCSIRDMTKKLDLDLTSVELVEIPDIYDRNFEQIIEWSGEFPQRKSKTEFLSSRFSVFKLPANMYDSQGFNSNGQLGVWIAGYQLKMYYTNPATSYHATGFERDWLNNKPIGRNHFDLNRNADKNDPNLQGKIGKFPYEQSWNLNYPEPYKIPVQPVTLNPKKYYDSSGNPYDFAEPVYLDGDMTQGYTLQNIGGTFSPNEFSRDITNESIFKYEDIDQWDEQYSNGYQPVLPNDSSPYGTISHVVNGEKWQRLECGYAYWLKPEGWPRVKNRRINGKQQDVLLDSDFISTSSAFPSRMFPNTYKDGITIIRENILLRTDSGVPYYKIGALDIYRIISPEKVNPPLSPPTSKFVNIHLQKLIVEGSVPGSDDPILCTLYVQSPTNSTFFNYGGSGQIEIKNRGTTTVTLQLNGESYELLPEEGTGAVEGVVSSDVILTLPGNSNYNSITNSYDRAKYEIILRATINDTNSGGFHHVGGGTVCYGGVFKVDENTGEENNIPNFYVVSVIPTYVWMNVQEGNKVRNLDIFFDSGDGRKVAINGFAYCADRGFPFNDGTDVVTYFQGTTPIYKKNSIIRLLPQPLETYRTIPFPVYNRMEGNAPPNDDPQYTPTYETSYAVGLVTWS